MPICAGCALEIPPNSMYKKCFAPTCQRHFHSGCTCGQHGERSMRTVNGAERRTINYNNFEHRVRRNSRKAKGVFLLIIGIYFLIYSGTRCVSLLNNTVSDKNEFDNKLSGINYTTIIPPQYNSNSSIVNTNQENNRDYSSQISCSGAPTSRLDINEDAKICTNKENLRLRSYPGTNSGRIIKSYSPGAVVWIMEGPECSNRMYWWKVKTPDGKIGWMAEGGATKATYYLCPN